MAGPGGPPDRLRPAPSGASKCFRHRRKHLAQGEFISPEQFNPGGPRRACPLGRKLCEAFQQSQGLAIRRALLSHNGPQENGGGKQTGRRGTGMTVIFGTKGADGRKAAHPLLDRSVRLLWGWEDTPTLERSPRGKPFFAGVTGRWLSLSHSGGYALCALSDDGLVGVDIEIVRPHRPGLPGYALSPEELAGFDGSWEDFARLWTRKESWCKREDAPLYPPRQVVVPADCACRGYAGPDWRAAVWCEGRAPEEIRWISL